MNFIFGNIYFLLLLLLIPCFYICKKKSRIFYFPKLSWVSKDRYATLLDALVKVTIFTLMVLSLGSPLLYESNSTQDRKGRDLVLAMDASGSMSQSGFGANDRFKSRFDTNIDLALNFIDKRYDDNMGIVMFGSFAYTASPLTYDLDSLSYLLEMTNVGIAGDSTAIGDALNQAIDTLSYGDAKSKVIILLTDGHHNAGTTSPKNATLRAKKLGIKIYTIGLGSKSEYDSILLETISTQSDAKSYTALSEKELKEIYEDIEMLEPSNIRSEEYLNKQLIIVYPLMLAIFILILWTIYLKRSRE